jgi:hypothetical protein
MTGRATNTMPSAISAASPIMPRLFNASGCTNDVGKGGTQVAESAGAVHHGRLPQLILKGCSPARRNTHRSYRPEPSTEATHR